MDLNLRDMVYGVHVIDLMVMQVILRNSGKVSEADYLKGHVLRKVPSCLLKAPVEDLLPFNNYKLIPFVMEWLRRLEDEQFTILRQDKKDCYVFVIKEGFDVGEMTFKSVAFHKSHKMHAIDDIDEYGFALYMEIGDISTNWNSYGVDMPRVWQGVCVNMKAKGIELPPEYWPNEGI